MATFSLGLSPTIHEPRKDQGHPHALSAADMIEIFSPISVLQVLACHALSPQAGDIIGHTLVPIAAGRYGTVSVGAIPKRQLNPLFTESSGRVSSHAGDYELVALKSLHELPPPTQHERVEKFPFKDLLPELTLLSAPPLLYHQNIVDILGYYWEPAQTSGVCVESGGNLQYAPTMILEFTELGSLDKYFEAGNCLTPQQRLGLCVDVCRALQTLHHEIEVDGKRLGLYHGDLKPQNTLIFRTEGGVRAKLSDLGSCTRYDVPPGRVPRVCLDQGTFGWLAPERTSKQFDGDNIEGTVDLVAAEIFSFGLLATYILLGGRELFRLGGVASLLSGSARLDQILVDDIANPTPDTLGTVLMAQQEALSENLDTIVNSIKEEIESGIDRGDYSVEYAIVAMAAVDATLAADPSKRANSFREICCILGSDPYEIRHRTPSERIPNVLDLQAQPSIQGHVHAIGALFLFPHTFRDVLAVHLETIYNRSARCKSNGCRQTARIAALLRGLREFVPPHVATNASTGLEWLRKAMAFDPADISRIFQLLGGRFDADDINTELQRLDMHESAQLVPPRENELQVTDGSASSSPAALPTSDSTTPTPGNSDLALHIAVATNNVTAAKALVAAGWDPSKPNSAGHTPWNLAVVARSTAMLSVLLHSDVQIDEQARRDSTERALCSPWLVSRLVCGHNMAERTSATLIYLAGRGIFTRYKVYQLVASPGFSDPDIAKTVLANDYTASPDPALLVAMLESAITTGELETVTAVLQRLPATSVKTSRAIFLLNSAIKATAPGSQRIFEELLKHFMSAININTTFTFTESDPETGMPPLVSPAKGLTLLHFAFSQGQISRAIALLRGGADASMASRDGAALTPLGQLLFTQTPHSRLALRELLASDYVTTSNPTFVVDHLVVCPTLRLNAFHFLCQATEESHPADPAVDTSLDALRALIAHVRRINPDRLTALLNAESANPAAPWAPLHQAAATGFWAAVKPLVRAGADPLLRVGADTAEDFAGMAPLHAADARSDAAWVEEFCNRGKMLRMQGFPWFNECSPVAEALRRDYEARTWKTVRELKAVVRGRGAEGKATWTRREEARAEAGLRVE